MVSVVPSIIPILTANAVAANQVKRKNKSLNNKEKKLKDSPLNNKINCRVFLNNGKVIEGHYEGNWYEDNSDEEGIWIKTDDGTKEINSKDYDRVEYYHKKTVNEAYIKAEKGNIYYTKNSNMFLSMVKSIFISKNIPVRVYYDTIKQMYVFGNAFDYIHADLANGMKYYSKIYAVDEMRANISYLKQNCALFQVLPDDNFKKYDMGDGYSSGWFLKLDDLIFACRSKEYEKVRDNVPLFKDHIGEWMDVQYYLSKKNNINESIEDKIIFEPTDATFVIGDKEFQDEGCDVYYIIINNTKVGMLALKKLYNGNIEIAGLEFGEPYRNKGYGKQVVKMLKDKYGKIYVRSIPDAKGFWDKQGHKSSWNDDSGTFDGMLDESIQNNTDEKLNSKNNCKIILKDGKIIYGHLLSVNENYVYINSDNGNRIKKDNIKELYMYYDCEVITKNGKTIYGNFAGDFGDHKLHLDDSFNRKGWAIKDEMIEKINYKKVIKHTFDAEKLNESVEEKILYIIRGVPGSGKSTLAHKLTDNVVEADQYFYDDKGNYNWSADKLNQAHNWCFYTVKKYMEEGRDKIAVANTFVKNKDYKRYVELAKEFSYKVDIRTCTGNYQNIHNVPDETVEKMRSKFQETPLDEELIHMEKSNYEDYYAVILKNPSRKELRDNNLRRSRIINFANDIWLFFDSMQWIHEEVLDEYAKQYGKAKNSGFYDYDKNQFIFIHSADDNEEQVFKKYEIEDKKWLLSHPYIVNVFGNNINVKVIDEYWNSPWDIEQLDESAENDKTLRDYATELSNICLDALVKAKYETRISKEQVQINVDKAFKKAVPMLKNSPYEYFLLLVSEKDEPNPSFGKTVDKKYGLISFPVFSSDPFDLSLSLLFKHKSTLNKLYSTYSGDELKLKIHEYAVKYLKNEIKKRLENKKNTYLGLLIHECTHLLDDVRRTKTYKSKEQNLKDDSGIEAYYNSSEEQNAYYQETVSIFDEWANQSVGYKTFDIFWDDFIRQYRGEYNMLNDKNKRKLKKRAYTYWYVYMKD